MKRNNIKDLVATALCAAIIAVCSWITVPMTVPFTLQTFAVFLALRLLGGAKGTLAVTVYILLGAVGVPVFSGFRGGLGHLLGSTGGYIIGFIASGLLYWLFEKFTPEKHIIRILELTLCLFVCYAIGTVWFWFVYASKNAMGVWAVLSACVIPFIIPDMVKLIAAHFLAGRLKKILEKV